MAQWLLLDFHKVSVKRHCQAVPAYLQWREVFYMLVLLTILTPGDTQKIPDLSAALQTLIIIQRLFNISTGCLKRFLFFVRLNTLLLFFLHLNSEFLCYFYICQKKTSLHTKVLKILANTNRWPFYVILKAKQSKLSFFQVNKDERWPRLLIALHRRWVVASTKEVLSGREVCLISARHVWEL